MSFTLSHRVFTLHVMDRVNFKMKNFKCIVFLIIFFPVSLIAQELPPRAGWLPLDFATESLENSRKTSMAPLVTFGIKDGWTFIPLTKCALIPVFSPICN